MTTLLGRLRGPAGLVLGIAVLGASGYGFLTVTARAVSASDYAALAALYLLTALVGPGLFMPVEQEATRVVTTRLAQGEGTRDAVRQLYRHAGLLLAAVAVALAAAGPLLVDRVFHGQAGLWWALVASVAGYAATSPARGIFAAHRRFGSYGLLCGVDGMARLLPCVVLAAVGVSSAEVYGLAFGLGPVVSLVVTAAMVPVGGPGPRLARRELVAGTAWLAVASALALALANIGPVLVTAMLPDDPARAGTFSFAFVLVRVPLFIVLGLQPMLLPVLTHAVASQDHVGLRRGVRHALVLVGGLGLVVLMLAAPVGRWLIGSLFVDAPAPSSMIVTLLAGGTVLATLAQVLQPALVAVASHRTVALAWAAGGLAFTVAFLLPLDPVAAATAAQLAACGATGAIMAVAVRRHVNAGSSTAPGHGRLLRSPRPGGHEPLPLD